MTWRCDHSHEQRGTTRCINCCIARPRHHVLCKAGGGTPARMRWLCSPCLKEYEGKGLLVPKITALPPTPQTGRDSRGHFLPDYNRIFHHGQPIQADQGDDAA